jgi:hypothetical protein
MYDIGEKNHETANELWVGYYKKNSGLPSLTWPESVDEAPVRLDRRHPQDD